MSSQNRTQKGQVQELFGISDEEIEAAKNDPEKRANHQHFSYSSGDGKSHCFLPLATTG